MDEAVDDSRHPETHSQLEGEGEAEARVLIGECPEGDIADRKASCADEAKEDELRTRHRGARLIMRETSDDDGGKADNGPGEKSAHTTFLSCRGTSEII